MYAKSLKLTLLYYRVLAGYSGEETWTPQEEMRLRRKIDFRLMPILCFSYALVYYDKAMISQAVSNQCLYRLPDVAN